MGPVHERGSIDPVHILMDLFHGPGPQRGAMHQWSTNQGSMFCTLPENHHFGPPSWMLWHSPWMKPLQAQFSFCQLLMLCVASASSKTCGAIATSDQEMAFSNGNTSEKQGRYEQKCERLLCQSKRPWCTFVVSGFSVSADSPNYRHDALGLTSHMYVIQKAIFPFTCCSVAILACWTGK